MCSIAFIPCIYIFFISPKFIWRVGYNIFSNFECILVITFSQIDSGKQGFCCPFIDISLSLIFSKISRINSVSQVSDDLCINFCYCISGRQIISFQRFQDNRDTQRSSVIGCIRHTIDSH